MTLNVVIEEGVTVQFPNLEMQLRTQCSIEQGSKFSVKGGLYVGKKKKKGITINSRRFMADHATGTGMEAVSDSLRVKMNLEYILPLESQRCGCEHRKVGSSAFDKGKGNL